jgi:hypothetical protein
MLAEPAGRVVAREVERGLVRHPSDRSLPETVRLDFDRTVADLAPRRGGGSGA